MYNAQHRYDEKQKIGEKLKEKGSSYGFRAYGLGISNSSSQVGFLDLGVCSNARGLYDDIIQSFPMLNIISWKLEGKTYLLHFSFKDDAFKLAPNDKPTGNIPMVPNVEHKEPVKIRGISADKIEIDDEHKPEVITLEVKPVKKGKKKDVI